jgi:hypothetical protein
MDYRRSLPFPPGAARSAVPGGKGSDADFVHGSLAGPGIWHILVGSADNAAKHFKQPLPGAESKKMKVEKIFFEVDAV